MSFRQAAFNLRLAFHEIIHCVIEIVLIRAKQRATVPLAHQHRRNILPIIGIKLDVSNRNLAEYELQIVSLTQNRRRVNPRISQSVSPWTVTAEGDPIPHTRIQDRRG